MAFVLSHAPLSVSRCRQQIMKGGGRVMRPCDVGLSPSLGLRPSPTPYLYRLARVKNLRCALMRTDVYAHVASGPTGRAVTPANRGTRPRRGSTGVCTVRARLNPVRPGDRSLQALLPDTANARLLVAACGLLS